VTSRRTVVGVLAVALFAVVWQLIGSHNIVRSDLISYPSEVVTTFVAMTKSGELGKNALVSILEFVQGYVPAAIVGVAAGVLLALIRPLRLLLDPLLVAIYTAPAIAFIPILVVWFGVGTLSKVVIVFLSAVFPIMINTRTGVVEVAEPWLRAVRAFGANRTQLVTKAILPGSLPAIMAGLRLALGRGIVALIAAEMYVSLAGIGRLIQVYSSAARASEIIVLVVVIAAFGFACVSLVRAAEQRLGTWRADFE
jgi:ABC-type nitrate/sulfonate/bicarbonate transport system permease component